MRKQPGGRGRGGRARNLVALDDETIYRSYAVEYFESVGAVQAFRGTETQVTLKATNEKFNFGAPMNQVGFDRLASIGIVESRKTEADGQIDFRWTALHPTDAYGADYVSNNPSYYNVERNVVPKSFAVVHPESLARVEATYVKYAREYQPYWSDSEFRDLRGIPDPGGMKSEANEAWADMATAANTYRAAMDAANDARDVQAAESAWDTVVSGLWLPGQ